MSAPAAACRAPPRSSLRSYRPLAGLGGSTIGVATVTSSKALGAGTTKMVSLAATVLAGSAFGFIFQVFLGQRDVLLTLVVLATVGAIAAVLLAHRPGRSASLMLMAFWGLAVIPAFTLVPDLGYSEYGRAVWMTSRISLELGHGWSSALGAAADGTDGPLNVLLFVPAGMFLTMATRRPAGVGVVLAMLSLVIEVVQAWSGTRSGTPGDFTANVIGACAGCGLGVVASAANPSPDDPARRGTA